jgi:hypothetical protein
MGASQWEYYVPYEPDLVAALRRLQATVFAERDYWWPYRDDAEHVPALDPLADQRWFGRCAILHDAPASPRRCTSGASRAIETAENRLLARCTPPPEIVAVGG